MRLAEYAGIHYDDGVRAQQHFAFLKRAVEAKRLAAAEEERYFLRRYSLRQGFFEVVARVDAELQVHSGEQLAAAWGIACKYEFH